MLAAILGPDCEAVRGGALGQPASTLSSLSFLILGGWCWYRARGSDARRLELVLFGAAAALVALGSLAFHGPHPSWSQWAHDSSIAWLLVLAIVLDLDRGAREVAGWILGCVGVGVLFWIAPESQRIVFTLLSAAFVLLEVSALRRRRRPWPGEAGFGLYAFAAAAFLLGALAFFLGRVGALCDPASWLQGHAVWHVLLAAALAAYVEVTLVAAAPYAADHD